MNKYTFKTRYQAHNDEPYDFVTIPDQVASEQKDYDGKTFRFCAATAPRRGQCSWVTSTGCGRLGPRPRGQDGLTKKATYSDWRLKMYKEPTAKTSCTARKATGILGSKCRS